MVCHILIELWNHGISLGGLQQVVGVDRILPANNIRTDRYKTQNSEQSTGIEVTMSGLISEKRPSSLFLDCGGAAERVYYVCSNPHYVYIKSSHDKYPTFLMCPIRACTMVLEPVLHINPCVSYVCVADLRCYFCTDGRAEE